MPSKCYLRLILFVELMGEHKIDRKFVQGGTKMCSILLDDLRHLCIYVISICFLMGEYYFFLFGIQRVSAKKNASNRLIQEILKLCDASICVIGLFEIKSNIMISSHSFIDSFLGYSRNLSSKLNSFVIVIADLALCLYMVYILPIHHFSATVTDTPLT